MGSTIVSKFQLNLMKNGRVIRGQNFRHCLPTLDCLFEPNVTFTDRDETGAIRKVWTKDSLNLFVQQTRCTDAFRVLISLLVLHAAPYILAQNSTSLRPINPIRSADFCCELSELLGYLRFPAQISIGFNVNLRTHFQQDALPRFP